MKVYIVTKEDWRSNEPMKAFWDKADAAQYAQAISKHQINGHVYTLEVEEAKSKPEIVRAEAA
jgi:hypothetical protein